MFYIRACDTNIAAVTVAPHTNHFANITQALFLLRILKPTCIAENRCSVD